MIENKQKLNIAFRKLRKEGYYAKQNFWCCQSCGLAAIPEDKDSYVFYHSQDFEDLKKYGTCYLTWAGNTNKIINILNEAGVWTEWDGNLNSRISIDLNKEVTK